MVLEYVSGQYNRIVEEIEVACVPNGIGGVQLSDRSIWNGTESGLQYSSSLLARFFASVH